MTHAATKSSCGVNGAASAAANPEMVELISRMVRTIFHVKVVSVTGKLFAELCRSKIKGTPRDLLALRANQPPPEFPLANRHDDLVHVLFVLKPIGEIKRICQAEHPAQVDELIQLYMVRIHDLDPDQPLPHYLSTEKKTRWIPASDLTPLAADMRKLLREALDERFFSRYYNDKQFHECYFVFEMQLNLHPIFKRTERSLDRAVVSSCCQHGKSGRDAVTRKNDVNTKIRCNLLDLLKAVSESVDIYEFEPPSSVVQTSRQEAEFAPRSSRPPTFSRQDRRAEEELDLWLEDPVDTARNADFTPKESILEFWQRLEKQGDYRNIPKAVRVLFAIPVCQNERDFGLSGPMVTTSRTTLAEHNLDMCSFFNRRSDFVDLLQCEEIPKGQHHTCIHLPASYFPSPKKWTTSWMR
ncbi:unnamed protein product [Phytophthora fragariaefolia]|uniref:Unnamed protein product n=1 Tax=Phytophthora fragariaefolia TaxID=1490495 RepID=A0A9W7CZB8_9STRA|nr:unnamed protein product [Phytophthora fragariaefolia]